MRRQHSSNHSADVPNRDIIAFIVAIILAIIWLLLVTIVLVKALDFDIKKLDSYYHDIFKLIIISLLLLYITYLSSQWFANKPVEQSSDEFFRATFTRWWRYIPFLFPAQKHLRQQLEHTKSRFAFLQQHCVCYQQYTSVSGCCLSNQGMPSCSKVEDRCKCSVIKSTIESIEGRWFGFVKWSDIRLFEAAIMQIESDNYLLLQAPSIIQERKKLISIVSTTANSKLKSTIEQLEDLVEGLLKKQVTSHQTLLFPSTSNKDFLLLRQGLIDIYTQSTHILISRDLRFDQRAILSVLNASMVFGSLLFIILSGTPSFARSTIFIGFIAGLAGASFSLQRRVFTAEIDEERWVRSFTGSIAPVLSIITSALFGGLAAILLFILLQLGTEQNLFNSILLPRYASPSMIYPPIIEFYQFMDLAPIDAKSYALHIILSFLSGFSERLLPDALDRLASNTLKQQVDAQKP